MTLGMRVFDRDLPQTTTLERAFDAGLAADRLAPAFTAAYHCAIARLLNEPVVPRCIAATERGGGHPRAMETTLTNNVLNGAKTFATLASVAEEILVVASRGVSDGKNRLVLVRVRPDASGVTIANCAPTPFAPEIPHAVVTLVDVRADDVLPGDGYERYLKPFRTVEDTHALAAILGYVLGAAKRANMSHELTEGLLGILPALEQVVGGRVSDPIAHLTLAGLFTNTRRLIAEHDAEWEKATPDERDRWRRDLPLLMIAEQARTKRTVAAWDTLTRDA